MNIRTKNCSNFINKNEQKHLTSEALNQLNLLKKKACKGYDFLGWAELPNKNLTQLTNIKKVSKQLKNFETVVVIGIGGSYLGAKALIDLFKPYFDKQDTEILFAGHHLDNEYLSELTNYLSDKNFALIPISKSGTTLEPAIAFRFLLNLLINRFGETDISSRIFPITDVDKGALRELVNHYKLSSFTIPNDVGGRFSVLSPVGLLPMSVAEVNIEQLLEGAKKGMEEFLKLNNTNPAIQYAATRNLLYQKGYTTELMVYSKPKWKGFSEWWKQLFGESEGKEKKGIFPSSLQVTTDLHSLGQFVQEGTPNLFETWIRFAKSHIHLQIQESSNNLDNLNYLAEKDLHFINNKAEEGTIKAHIKGQVPIIEITIDDLTAYNMGNLIAFYEVSCAISALLMGVNPFNQPGVEAYKQNMFKLLEKK